MVIGPDESKVMCAVIVQGYNVGTWIRS